MSLKNEKQMIVVLEGPSGVGKDTIMNGLIQKYPQLFEHVVSTTTRAMREYESQGNPYNFVTDEEFEKRVKSGEIFEYTERHGTKRGMSKHVFDDILNRKKIPIKDCDAVGLNALKKVYGDRVFGVFIVAPKKEIKKRLLERGDADIEKRLQNYDEHLKQAVFYDVEIENIVLDKAIKDCYEAIMKQYENLK